MQALHDITHAVARAFEVPAGELRTDGRVHRVSHPRQAAFFLARRREISSPIIGTYYGCDHSTVIYGAAKAFDRAMGDDDFALRLGKAIRALERMAKQRDEEIQRVRELLASERQVEVANA